MPGLVARGLGSGRSSSPPVVLVFGELGIGNLGNEASLTEALRRLDVHLPGAEVRVLSYEPALTAVEHHGEHPRWSVLPIDASTDPRARSLPDRLPGRWGPLVRQLAAAVRVARASRGADLVVVPGTGVLEELWVGAWGVPVLLVGLAAGARLHRAPLAIVAVGADLPERRLTRAMFALTLRSATLVTFRDEHSRDAGAAMLGRRGRDRLGEAGRARLSPDLVLGAASPPEPGPDEPGPDEPGPDEQVAPGGRPRLVLGVMRYYGASDDAQSTDGAAIHERYLASLTTFAARLLARGWTVDVVVGDAGDLPVAREAVARLGQGARLRPVATMRALDDVVAGSTAVVASRYHNIVSALRAGVPVVSVSYGPKGHALMGQVGMAGSCQWIEDLDAALLGTQVDDAVARSAEITDRLRRVTAVLRGAADAPWDAAARLVGMSPVARSAALVEETV